MYSLAIVDDNADQVELARLAVESFVERSIENGFLCEGFDIRAFANPSELAEFVGDNTIDICLMDICFEEGVGADVLNHSGIEAVRQLFPEGCGTQVIYLSAYVEYCSRVYETPHTWFLTKPIKQDELDQALTKAVENLRRFRSRPLLIMSGGKQLAIAPSRIRYIESCRRKVAICTHKGTFETYAKLSELLSQLPESFYQCHKSFIVNMAHIEELGTQFIRLTSGESVPVSRSRRNGLREAYVAFIRTGM